jgi:pyridoxine 5-phosphate synthase
MIDLAVNIDHVATVRNARGFVEPDPIQAALIAEKAGASGIVCHLREDRRHIQDKDVFALKDSVTTKLDLEMAASEEIIDIALKVKPYLVTIVPEKREELTTEGGLDIYHHKNRFKDLTKRFQDKGIKVSYFIEASEEQIYTAAEIQADIIELHTGHYAESPNAIIRQQSLDMLSTGGKIAHSLGLEVTAGHGLNYHNILPIKEIPGLIEVSIGHALISKALFVGMESAVKDMLKLLS